MNDTKCARRTLKEHILSSLMSCQYPASATKEGPLDLFQAQLRRTLEQLHPYLRSKTLVVQRVNIAVLKGERGE